MKVLLDENLPHDLRREIPGHDVFTVQYLGWSGTKNGLLLSRAVADGFSLFVTMDSGVAYQQYLPEIPLAIVVIQARSNDMDDLRPLMPAIRKAIADAKPRTICRVT